MTKPRRHRRGPRNVEALELGLGGGGRNRSIEYDMPSILDDLRQIPEMGPLLDTADVQQQFEEHPDVAYEISKDPILAKRVIADFSLFEELVFDKEMAGSRARVQKPGKDHRQGQGRRRSRTKNKKVGRSYPYPEHRDQGQGHGQQHHRPSPHKPFKFRNKNANTGTFTPLTSSRYSKVVHPAEASYFTKLLAGLGQPSGSTQTQDEGTETTGHSSHPHRHSGSPSASNTNTAADKKKKWKSYLKKKEEKEHQEALPAPYWEEKLMQERDFIKTYEMSPTFQQFLTKNRKVLHVLMKNQMINHKVKHDKELQKKLMNNPGKVEEMVAADVIQELLKTKAKEKRPSPSTNGNDEFVINVEKDKRPSPSPRANELVKTAREKRPTSQQNDRRSFEKIVQGQSSKTNKGQGKGQGQGQGQDSKPRERHLSFNQHVVSASPSFQSLRSEQLQVSSVATIKQSDMSIRRAAGSASVPGALRSLYMAHKLFLAHDIDIKNGKTVFTDQKKIHYEIRDHYGSLMYYAYEKKSCCSVKEMVIIEPDGPDLVVIKGCQSSKIDIFCPPSESIGTIIRNKGCLCAHSTFDIKDEHGHSIININYTKNKTAKISTEYELRDAETFANIGTISGDWLDLPAGIFPSRIVYGVEFPKDIHYNVKIAVMAAWLIIYKLYFNGAFKKNVHHEPNNEEKDVLAAALYDSEFEEEEKKRKKREERERQENEKLFRHHK